MNKEALCLLKNQDLQDTQMRWGKRHKKLCSYVAIFIKMGGQSNRIKINLHVLIKLPDSYTGK